MGGSPVGGFMMSMGDWLRRLLHAPSPPEPEPSSGPAPRPPTVAARRLEVSPADATSVERAVEVMLLHPEADQERMLVLLEGCDLTAPEAWRAYQLLPIAFTHVVMRGQAVQFQPGYILLDPDTGARSSHLLADEPLYVAGVASAERRLAESCTLQQLLPVFGRSAEYDAIRQAGGQVDGMIFTEPLLMTFGG